MKVMFGILSIITLVAMYAVTWGYWAMNLMHDPGLWVFLLVSMGLFYISTSYAIRGER